MVETWIEPFEITLFRKKRPEVDPEVLLGSDIVYERSLIATRNKKRQTQQKLHTVTRTDLTQIVQTLLKLYKFYFYTL